MLRNIYIYIFFLILLFVMNNEFEIKVLQIVEKIPFGKVTTYGEIARACGLRASARMVGWILNANRYNSNFPFHRVVNRNGELTGRYHFSTPTLMKELLLSEGIEFEDEKVNLKKHLWIPNVLY